MYNKLIPILILGGFWFTSGCATTLSTGKPSQKEVSLTGAWELHADDETTGAELANEMLFLYPNGQLLVEGTASFRGKYSQNEETLTMVINHTGRELHVSRKFSKDATGLHLANRTKGFAHYRKKEAPFPQWNIDDDWQRATHGQFSFKVPADWEVKSAPPDPQGSLRLQITNRNNTKMLLLLLIPNDESVDIDDLIQGFGKELMARTPDLSMRLKKLKTTELFGIQGTVYGIDSQDSGVPMTIRIVGAPKNETSSLLAIVVYNQDVLGELELMVESLQISLP